MTRAVFNAETLEQILKVTQAEVARLTEQLAIEKGTADRCMMERDKARNYAKEARMRENKAEDARVSASFRATKVESDLEILRGELDKNAKNALETMLKLSRDISALTAERDQLKWSMEKYEERAEKAEEKTARLRTLLAPFADMLDVLEEPSTTTAGAEHETTFAAPDDFIIQAFPVPCHEEEKSSDYVTLCTVGDIRKARKALEEK